MWTQLKQVNKPIVLYGSGNACERIMKELESRDIDIAGIFVSDDFVRPGKTFHGFELTTYAKLKEKYKEFVILLCFGTDRKDVIEHIKFLETEQDLYAPDLPVIGEGLFTKEYYKEKESEIKWLRNILADEESKRVLDGVLNYRLSGKLQFLRDVESSDAENIKLLDLDKDETYLDFGAYTGDTVAEFIKTVGTYNFIVAVEPESRNFRKLSEYSEAACLKNIELINAAVSDDGKPVEFSAGSGRGSLSKKTRIVETITIDSLYDKGFHPGYIKMDVEGSEMAAIRGGIRTISECKPKMLIAAYHRIDDLWEIPKAVLKIRPDYKLFLRHSPCIPNWETNFYFI